MSKRSLCTLWSILILMGTLGIDQLSKVWGRGLSSLHYNQGFMMGLYADLPDSLRIVALVAFAGFILFLYLSLMFVIPVAANWVKYGLSFLVGGIFGNVIDKMIYGRTVDFIPLSVGSVHLVFNVADIFQWIGVTIVLWMIFKWDWLIWFPGSSRGNYLINPKEQLRFAANFSLVALVTSVVLGIFSFAFFRTLMVDMNLRGHKMMISYFATYIMLTLLFCAMSFITGIVLSHRNVGPVYALEKYLDNLMKGEDAERKFTLRNTDNFKQLESIAEKIRSHLQNK